MRPSFVLLLITLSSCALSKTIAKKVAKDLRECAIETVDRLETPCEWAREIALCMGHPPKHAELLLTECLEHKGDVARPPVPAQPPGEESLAPCPKS